MIKISFLFALIISSIQISNAFVLETETILGGKNKAHITVNHFKLDTNELFVDENAGIKSLLLNTGLTAADRLVHALGFHSLEVFVNERENAVSVLRIQTSDDVYLPLKRSALDDALGIFNVITDLDAFRGFPL